MTELDRLLRRIADGETSPDVLARARALLLVDTRLPPDLREVGLEDDEPAVAASALLGVLGLDDGLFGGLLGEALRAEAGDDLPWELPAAEPEPEPVSAGSPPGVTVAMLQAQEAEGLPPVADAVRSEAGDTDVALAVLRDLHVEVIDVAAAVAGLAGEVDVAAEVAVRLGDLPMPLRTAITGEAGEAEVAAGVVAPLGEVVWPIADAIRAEAGEIDVVAAVVPDLLPVADAVRAEAGEIDIAAQVTPEVTPGVEVAAAVRDEAGEVDVWEAIGGAFTEGWASALLDHELPPAAHRLAARRLMRDREASDELAAFAEQGRTLRAALGDEAGETPYIWGAVARRIGIEEPEVVPGYDGALLAEAVRAEAGPVRIERGVMDRIQRDKQAAEPLDLPAPANRPAAWQWLAMVGAVALVMIVLVGRLGGPVLDLVPTAPEDSFAAQPLDFAGSGEVTLEELSYDEDVDVIVTLPDEDGDRPLIIRINEEA